MTLPRVSIIVATYRRTESLKKAIESLIRQTYMNYEIVVVDDNDNVEWNQKVSDIIREVKQKNPDILLKYIVNHPNQGSAKARNIGINATEGEYITFLDDDDIYLPDKLETQVTQMLVMDADFSLTDLMLYNEKEKLIDKRVRTYLNENDGSVASLLQCHLKYHMTGTDTFMFRREYLLAIGGFDAIDVGDEFYLMQKAICAGGKFYYLPECHVKAYVHTGEEGLSSGKSKIDGENQLYEYKRKFFSEIDAKSRRYIIMRHYAVLAFAGLRIGKLLFAFKSGMRSFFASPIQCMKLCLERKI